MRGLSTQYHSMTWAYSLYHSGWFKVTSRFDPDCDIDSGPLREVVRRARSVFGDFEVIDVTIGYRPCTPDGLPIIGDKTYMATGGCRLG